MAGWKICPQCKYANEENEFFCRNCGKDLMPAVQPVGPPSSDEPRAQAEAMKCQSCGSAVSPQSAYCKSCGRPVHAQHAPAPQPPPPRYLSQAPTKMCAQCGRHIRSDAKFCPYCGFTYSTSRNCPYCGMQVQVNSQACPYCGRSFVQGSKMGAGIATVLYVLSFLLPPLGWIVGLVYYMKPEEEYKTVGRICIIVATISFMLGAICLLIPV